jgi:hypothetical protein
MYERAMTDCSQMTTKEMYDQCVNIIYFYNTRRTFNPFERNSFNQYYLGEGIAGINYRNCKK